MSLKGRSTPPPPKAPPEKNPDPSGSKHKPGQQRRKLSNRQKLRILEEADAIPPGELLAYLKPKGLAHSHLRYWRQLREAGKLPEVKPKVYRLTNPKNPNYRPPGPKVPGSLPEAVPEFQQKPKPNTEQFNWYKNQIVNEKIKYPTKWNDVQFRPYEEHHAWPKFLGGSENGQDLVKLDPMYHHVITQAMNRRLKGKTFKNDCERLQFLKEFYRDYPLIPYNATSGPSFQNPLPPTLKPPSAQWWEYPGAI